MVKRKICTRDWANLVLAIVTSDRIDEDRSPLKLISKLNLTIEKPITSHSNQIRPTLYKSINQNARNLSDLNFVQSIASPFIKLSSLNQVR